MKSLTKKLFYLILIGAINFGICSIPWIPSKFLEIVLWAVFGGLTLLSIYLIVRIIKESYKILLHKYSTNTTYTLTTFISLGLIGVFGFVNFINFLFFVFSGWYVNEYEFDNKFFYVHDTSFMSSICEISVKVDYLPIRKEIVSFQEVAKNVRLHKDENMVYFLMNEKKHDLYDLNTSSIVIVWR